MKLGTLIRLLKMAKPDANIRFDFCGLIPDGLESYRGYYDQLAIGWKEDRGNAPKVSDILGMLKKAVGETFTGYKGGEYTMNEHTEVWVSNYGQCDGTIISGIRDNDWNVIIETRSVD